MYTSERKEKLRVKIQREIETHLNKNCGGAGSKIERPIARPKGISKELAILGIPIEPGDAATAIAGDKPRNSSSVQMISGSLINLRLNG